MNLFGRIFKISIFGESHGKGVGIVIDGCPPGIALAEKEFEGDLARRKSGAKGTTSRREDDEPIFLSGVHDGKTTGSPVAVLFHNADVISSDYDVSRTCRGRATPTLLQRRNTTGSAISAGEGISRAA